MTLTIMGIDVNVDEKTLAIPAKEMREIVEKCEMFVNMTSFNKRQLQSLLGKLLYVSKVVKPARAFLNRMLNNLRAIPERGHYTCEQRV